MLKRHEVQVLLAAGHSQEDVARRTGVSLRSVRRISREPGVVRVEDQVAREERRIGRPSKVESFRKAVVELLEAEPRLASREVLRRMREAGYRAGKSALYGLIASVRPQHVALETRFDGLPGEFAQHDFGHVDVKYLDGTISRVHFFASRLKYSRWVQVSLVPNEQVETLVRHLVDHYEAMGGVPLLSVFDRPKTVALKWDKSGHVTEWNSTFAYVMLELGVGVELCWPHSPEQKGSVENLVKWVKGSFFKQRTFHDRDDLVAQLAQWCTEANEVVASRATGVPPAQRMVEERPRLRPLKVGPRDLALRVPAYVMPTGDVYHEGHPYTMPPEAAGFPATIFLFRDRLKIVAGRYTTEHERKFGKGEGSSHSEHRAARLAAVHGVRAKRYRKRQDLLEVGPIALDYMTELVHRKPRSWWDDVDELHELLQSFGPAALGVAFAKALQEQRYDSVWLMELVANLVSTPDALPAGEVAS